MYELYRAADSNPPPRHVQRRGLDLSPSRARPVSGSGASCRRSGGRWPGTIRPRSLLSLPAQGRSWHRARLRCAVRRRPASCCGRTGPTAGGTNLRDLERPALPSPRPRRGCAPVAPRNCNPDSRDRRNPSPPCGGKDRGPSDVPLPLRNAARGEAEEAVAARLGSWSRRAAAAMRAFSLAPCGRVKKKAYASDSVCV
jgi:hypothetical protein